MTGKMCAKLFVAFQLLAVGVCQAEPSSATARKTKGRAEQKIEVPPVESGVADGKFRMDKNLPDSLFDATLQEAKGERDSKVISAVVIPQVSIVKLSKMTLSNDYFSVPYDSNAGSVPFVSITAGSPSPILQMDVILAYLEFSIGYGYADGIYDVQSKTGLTLKDTIQLSWVPILGFLRFEYDSPLRPSILIGGGQQWLSQSGQLQGLQQGFWIPTVRIGACITLFDPDDDKRTNFFQGVRVGSTYQKSILTKQEIVAWSFDLGSDFLF